MPAQAVAVKERAKKFGRLGSKAHLPYVMPTMVVMTLLIGIPIISVFVVSLTNYQLAMNLDNFQFIGLRNYERLFFGANPIIYYSLAISLGMVVVCTAIQLVLGMASALLLNHDGIKFKGVIIACLIVPIVMTPSIASLIWKLMLNTEFGVINYFLDKLFGFSVVWLGADNALLSVLLVSIWNYTPFVTLIMYAGLRSLPKDPYEAALIDGASRFQVFFYVTLPMLKQLILITVMFRCIDMIRIFDTPFVLTQGGPGSITEFIGLFIYRTGFGVNTQVARAAAISVILLLIVSVISSLLIYAMRKKV